MMMPMLLTDSVPGCKRDRESWSRATMELGGACKLEEGRATTMVQKLSVTDSMPAARRCKRSGEFAGQHDSEIACKLARYGEEGEEVEPGGDPLLDILGVDTFESHILSRLDSRSLARSAAVCSRWRPLALADSLWQPLVKAFLAQRAHLPLCLMGPRAGTTLKQHLLYAIAVTESRQDALVAAEMCGRTWELRLKPPCGPYWLAFDPTQVGKPGLNRYFSCNGRLSSDPGDPIWGGHACVWEFIRHRDGDGPPDQVRVNHWPPLAPRRVEDGRWVLENYYGLYITRPDNPTFSSSSEQRTTTTTATKLTSSERRCLCRNACTPHNIQQSHCKLLNVTVLPSTGELQPS